MASGARRAAPRRGSGPPPGTVRRVRARIEGTVQGVGFRPYVHRLATGAGLAGQVLNDERGVLLEVEGPSEAVEDLLRRLPAEAPPLAEVERMRCEELAPAGRVGFAIAGSARGRAPAALVSADAAPCGDCLTELFDPGDRRHRYPFVNCTNCGPRFTIVRGVPYDRELTTMAAFAMCDRCRAEYEDPADRRFHAEPNACPECGPSLRLAAAGGRTLATVDEALRSAARELLAGRILAVKGLGGFHLACRADRQDSVAALRARKLREHKPFALMVPSLDAARAVVELGPEEERLLEARERPIVLAPRRSTAPVADAVAPRAAELGLMLPYTPLHHLLLADAATTLVMTSGNVSDEPIAYRDEEAIERLRGLADLFLLHDRPIHMRTDDSVVRTVAAGGARRPLALRRSRGYVPASVDLPEAAGAERPLLACGAELKSTFCVAKGRRAWVGHHIGDLGNWETLRSFREGVEHFERLFAVDPEVVAHDLHPDYLSTRYALEREGVEHVAVQHHHAHLAACLAEHGEEGPAVGAIYDGTGHGTDGTVWGGELLVGGLEGFERAGSLWPVRMPGGDQAVRQPWRMACAWLLAALGREPPLPPALSGRVEPRAWSQVAGIAASGLASPVTTSAGRLFDAIAALCGVGASAAYEGQAAVELEWAAGRGGAGSYEVAVVEGLVGEEGPRVRLDPREAVLRAARDARAGVSPGVVGARFHAGLAEATARAALEEAARRGIDAVVLSGGVFQNRLLLERVAGLLREGGARVLVPERLPPNDGGIAYGQAAVAALPARAAARGTTPPPAP